MNISLPQWFRNVSIAKKLYFTVGIMAMLIVIELAALVFSIRTVSSVRAYVGAEGLWSKAQKDAMYQLLQYGRTHAEEDYDKFYRHMVVPMGDSKTRQELSKELPDIAEARQGFIEGKNHPDDISGMIYLFRRFYFVSYIARAIDAWSEADPLIAEFIPIGEQLHAEISSSAPSQARIDAILNKIDPINERLTVLEDEFSYALGEGSRWLENLVLRVLFSIALTVELTGLTLAIIVSRGISRGLNEILVSAKAVSHGKFDAKARIFSRDEIGVLANDFNLMAEKLKHSIDNIEQAQQKFEGILESAPDAIVMIDMTGSIQMLNQQTERLFNYDKEELLGKDVAVLIPARYCDDQAEQVVSFFMERSYNQQTESFELTGLTKEGQEFPVEIRYNYIATSEGMLLCGVIRDISERKYIRELESKNRELEQFASISSHDLQEPLTTIISFIDLMGLEFGDKLDDNAATYMSYVKSSAKRMSLLISGLLEYSRIGRVRKLELVNCNTLLQNVLMDMKALIDTCEPQLVLGELPTITAARTELHSLFQNLISNAIKYRKSMKEPPVIRINAVEEEHDYHFTVEDNGIGIDKKYFDKIFVIFQRLTTPQKVDGTGIGLSYCKKIVDIHHGRIWVESEPGQGSCFHFTIPKEQ